MEPAVSPTPRAVHSPLPPRPWRTHLPRLVLCALLLAPLPALAVTLRVFPTGTPPTAQTVSIQFVCSNGFVVAPSGLCVCPGATHRLVAGVCRRR